MTIGTLDIEKRRLQDAEFEQKAKNLRQTIDELVALARASNRPVDEIVELLAAIRQHQKKSAIQKAMGTKHGVTAKAQLDDRQGGPQIGQKPVLDEYSIGRIADKLANDILMHPRNTYGQVTEGDIQDLIESQTGDQQLARKLASSIFSHSRAMALTQDEIANIIIPALGGKPRVTVFGMPVVRKPR